MAATCLVTPKASSFETRVQAKKSREKANVGIEDGTGKTEFKVAAWLLPFPRFFLDCKTVISWIRFDSMSVSFLEKPYSDRQLIVVAPDEVVIAEKEAELTARKQSNSKDSSIYWHLVTQIVLTILPGALAGQLIGAALVEAIKAWNKARENGVAIVVVPISLGSQLILPPGHPRDKVVYVGHPAIPPVYYTVASFHRLCFEHKFCEAIQLLMALGANQISVEHVSGLSSEFATSLNMPFDGEGIKGKAGSSVSTHTKKTTHHLFKANLTGTKEPKIPDGLVWYNHEPTWRQIAEGRLNYGLRDFSLYLRYEDDFGINAGLKMELSKVGLDVGGKFEDHTSTVWKINGTFL